MLVVANVAFSPGLLKLFLQVAVTAFSALYPLGLTRVVHGEGFGPLLSGMCQTVSQPDPLPCKQAVRSDRVKQGGVKDIVGGLGHHQTTAQEVEVIERHKETWRER